MLRSKKDEIGGKTSPAKVPTQGGGDNPTTDEWTADTVRGLLYEDLSEETGVSNVMDAHNAALAYWQGVATQEWHKGFAAGTEQLAAEREATIEHAKVSAEIIKDLRSQVQTLWDTLKHTAKVEQPVQLPMINEDPVITLK